MSDTFYSAADACRDAGAALGHADWIANGDNWPHPETRYRDVANELRKAQALALVSIAANLENLHQLLDARLEVRL